MNTITREHSRNTDFDRTKRRRANLERIEIAHEMLSRVRSDLETIGASFDQQTANILDSVLMLAADVRLLANTEAGHL